MCDNERGKVWSMDGHWNNWLEVVGGKEISLFVAFKDGGCVLAISVNHFLEFGDMVFWFAGIS